MSVFEKLFKWEKEIYISWCETAFVCCLKNEEFKKLNASLSP